MFKKYKGYLGELRDNLYILKSNFQIIFLRIM